MAGSIALSALTHAMICVSEKAANIARVIRSEQTLFDLLVEEKTGAEKNKRFTEDFKTLADVLVQETVKRDLKMQFNGLSGSIRGEESNIFTNTLGDSVTIEVGDSADITAKTLVQVLDGHDDASVLLAKAAHTDVEITPHKSMQTSNKTIAAENVGLWIDPIDSTAQYIHGGEGMPNSQGIYADGLRCALILIGAYDLRDGKPIAGVMNQPFSRLEDGNSGTWSGCVQWGICYDDCRVHSVAPPEPEVDSIPDHLNIITSASEPEDIQHKLLNSTNSGLKFKVHHSAGAGYKALCAINHTVHAYLLTKDSTYRWDTCAPQAVLSAQGGGLCNFKAALNMAKQLISNGHSNDHVIDCIHKNCQVTYNVVDRTIDVTKINSLCQNVEGIVAYVDKECLLKIIKSVLM